MNADRALKVLVQTARDEIRRTTTDTMAVIRTGKGVGFHNPFTGKMQEKYVAPGLRTVESKLAASGLSKDPEFLAALEQVLQNVALLPISGLFSAFDGEGSFAEEVWYEIHAKDIGPLPTYLHEMLYPIDGDLLADKDA